MGGRGSGRTGLHGHGTGAALALLRPQGQISNLPQTLVGDVEGHLSPAHVTTRQISNEVSSPMLTT